MDQLIGWIAVLFALAVALQVLVAVAWPLVGLLIAAILTRLVWFYTSRW